jgi:hypothetical protein
MGDGTGRGYLRRVAGERKGRVGDWVKKEWKNGE